MSSTFVNTISMRYNSRTPSNEHVWLFTISCILEDMVECVDDVFMLCAKDGEAAAESIDKVCSVFASALEFLLDVSQAGFSLSDAGRNNLG